MLGYGCLARRGRPLSAVKRLPYVVGAQLGLVQSMEHVDYGLVIEESRVKRPEVRSCTVGDAVAAVGAAVLQCRSVVDSFLGGSAAKLSVGYPWRRLEHWVLVVVGGRWSFATATDVILIDRATAWALAIEKISVRARHCWDNKEVGTEGTANRGHGSTKFKGRPTRRYATAWRLFESTGGQPDTSRGGERGRWHLTDRHVGHESRSGF
jgi:hypothetical protein